MLLIAMLVISMSACSRKDGSDTETSQTDERVLYDSSGFLKDIPEFSGDDAIPRNLITGTSYLNRNGMLPFETEIGDYVTETGNHVMYRVTPIFKGEELLARGVHMEAVSVEDGGEGVSFNVYCYNVEPGVEIDYATGDNKAKSEEEIRNEIAGAPDAEGRYKIILNANPIKMKYHLTGCGNLGDIKPEFYQEYELTVDELKEKDENEGWEPCGGCKPDVILGIKE